MWSGAPIARGYGPVAVRVVVALVEGEGVEVGAWNRRRRGAKVEDPDNLEWGSAQEPRK